MPAVCGLRLRPPFVMLGFGADERDDAFGDRGAERFDVGGAGVERRCGGQHDGAALGQRREVAQVDERQGRLAHDQNQPPPLFEHDVGRPFDYEFRFDRPESPVILDARPNGLLSGKSYYQWKNQQAIPLTDDLFANDSFCMAGLRTGTIGICEKDTGRNITCRVEGYPYSLIWSAPAKPVRFVCIEPWHSLPAAATDPQDWEQRAAAACLAPGESWQTTLSTTFDR